MKKIIVIAISILFFVQLVTAQNKSQEVPEANPTDVSSIDAIVKAVYEVISGDAGVKRDWDRFRSLFHPDALLIPIFKDSKSGKLVTNVLTPKEFAKASADFSATNSFYETEIARKTEKFGNMVHVFSTYAGKRKPSDKEPFLRGINSMQLMYDGKRWWFMTIFWQAESPDLPLPKKYLKSN